LRFSGSASAWLAVSQVFLRLRIFSLAHHSSPNGFEIIWQKLNIVEQVEQELVDRHFAPLHVGFLGLFLATLARKNGR
jgi:hypothetical protein